MATTIGVVLDMYRQNASIAERMKVLDFAKSLQKQDTDSGKSGQMVSNPNQVSMPTAPLSTPPEMSGGLTPEEMNAMVTSGKVYKSSKEALADAEQRLSDLATDITAHIGTIGQAKYTDGLDGGCSNDTRFNTNGSPFSNRRNKNLLRWSDSKTQVW